MIAFTESLVTPGAVAPPLFLPSGHGFTQRGPVPWSASDVRPFSAQLSCARAAFEPIPRPAGCGPTPFPVASADAATAPGAPVTPSAPAAATTTNTATKRRGR